MNFIGKLKERIQNRALDVGDWFHRVGDNFFEVQQKINELNEEGFLPDKVNDLLNVLDEKVKVTDTRYQSANGLYETAKNNRANYFDKLVSKREELKYFKKEHHGILARIMYNFTPLRFLHVGREYQQLRKEIRVLKREYAYWNRYTDDSEQVFRGAEVQRKEAMRAASEYKRIIVSKANAYKDEFKLIKEYEKLQIIDKNAIREQFGKETKVEMVKYMNLVMANWYDMEKVNPPFDVRRVTKVVSKMNKGKKLNDEEKKVMNAIKRNAGNRNTGNTINHQTRQPNIFSVDGINRNVVEKMIENENDPTWSKLSPEQYMAVLGLTCDTTGQVTNEEKEKYNKIIKGEDNDLIQSCALKGTEKLKEYMEMSDDEKKAVANDTLKDVEENYKKSKKDLDDEQNARNAARQQGTPVK